MMMASSPKLVLDQMAAPVPEIMDGSLYSMMSHRKIEISSFLKKTYRVDVFLASPYDRNSF
jgi:hypothetical protein